MTPLEPDRAGMAELGRAVLDRAIDFVAGLPDRPANTADQAPDELVRELLAPPPEGPGDLAALLDRVERAAAYAFETAGPGYLAYIPGGGLFASAVADLYARVTNRYVGLAAPAPALAALEHSVVRWLAGLCGLPEGSGGLLVPGGSIANFSAVIAARHAGLGDDLAAGTLYVSAQTHQSVAKAARLAGIPAAGLRIVPCTPDLRMDVAAAAGMVAADRAAGRRPFLLVGSAGTTNTGAVDPLPELAALARRNGMWFHVDGAYGGMFRLTDRGRERMRGMEHADSVTLDPHKTLFLPYGTGALVVRDPARLAAAHESGGHYLQDLAAGDELPDYAHLGPELTRDPRGLRVWLPLHLYGVAAFRAALDEKLDLAELAHGKLAAEPLLEVPWSPELSTVAFRMRASGVDGTAAADAASRRLLERINAGRRIFLSSTVIDGRYTLRLCIVSHRTHAERIAEAVDIITTAAHQA
jgi:aromatic-L-amino-acid/L-tryptophan decarboxylase